MNARIFFWSLTSALAGFLFGFDTVVIYGAEKTIQALWGLSPGLHGIAMASALYVADQVAGREFAPDSFPPDEWDAAYLRSIGCSGDPGQWTRPAARFA